MKRFTLNHNLKNMRVIGVVHNFIWQIIHSAKLSRVDVQDVKLVISRNLARVQYKGSMVVMVMGLVEVLVLILGLEIRYIMLKR